MMGDTAKYVITALHEPIVFPPTRNHSEMVDGFEEPISAGFVRVGINPEGRLVVKCYGDSLSLGLSARPQEDADLIEHMLRGVAPL